MKYHAPYLFSQDPTKGIKAIGISDPEPRAYNEHQVRSLKSICDRLERFHQKKWREGRGQDAPVKAHARLKRDCAIIYTFLSTGLQR